MSHSCSSPGSQDERLVKFFFNTGLLRKAMGRWGRGADSGHETNPVTSQILTFPICQMGLFGYSPSSTTASWGSCENKCHYQKAKCSDLPTPWAKKAYINLETAGHPKDQQGNAGRGLPLNPNVRSASRRRYVCSS